MKKLRNHSVEVVLVLLLVTIGMNTYLLLRMKRVDESVTRIQNQQQLISRDTSEASYRWTPDKAYYDELMDRVDNIDRSVDNLSN